MLMSVDTLLAFMVDIHFFIVCTIFEGTNSKNNRVVYTAYTSCCLPYFQKKVVIFFFHLISWNNMTDDLFHLDFFSMFGGRRDCKKQVCKIK